jgi:RecB family endonuclease NucS
VSSILLTAPFVPLCTERRTPAGPIDIAFINPAGRLTLVEFKLWRNAEARRKVVAPALDYARTIKGWSYADVQRQAAMA